MQNLSIKLLIPVKYNTESFWNQVWVVSWNISTLSAVIWLWKNTVCESPPIEWGGSRRGGWWVNTVRGEVRRPWPRSKAVAATNVYEYCVTFFYWFGSLTPAGRAMRLSEHMFGRESKRQYSDMRCVSEAWKTLDVHNGEFLLIMPVEISKMLQSGTVCAV